MDSTLDMAFWLTAAGILGLIVLSGFFSGSEIALTAASRGKLKAQADKGSKGADAAMQVTEDNERMIGALLLGNNIVNILSASLATALLMPPVPWLVLLAVALAAVNVFGGFLVTRRMLEMFKPKKAEKEEVSK